LAQMPTWLRRKIEEAAKARSHPSERGDRESDTPVGLAGIALAGVPEGERDETLFRFASKLRADGYPRDVAEGLVLLAADECDPPFPEKEALAKVASAYGRYPPGTSSERSSRSSSPSRGLVRRDREDGGEEPPPLRMVRFADLPPVPDKRRYAVEKMVPAKFPTVVYGEGGVAKSLLAASLLQAAARGDEEWMGFRVEEPGPGLYVDFELDEEEQNRRMRQLALGHNPDDATLPEDLYYICAAAYPVREVLQLALDSCVEYGVGLMVLDSMGVALQGDAEASRDVIGFFRNYVDPFRAAGVAVLIVDHQAKLQFGEGYHDKSPFGSVYKGNLTRSVVQVQPEGRAEDELTVRLRHQKANFGPKFDPFEIVLRFNEAWVRLERSDLGASDLATEGSLFAPDKVRHALADGPAYPDDLSEATGLATKTIQNTLTKLKKKGVVEETGEISDTGSRKVRLSSSPLHTMPREREDGGEDDQDARDSEVLEFDYSDI
jgi:hypothetical protein